MAAPTIRLLPDALRDAAANARLPWRRIAGIENGAASILPPRNLVLAQSCASPPLQSAIAFPRAHEVASVMDAMLHLSLAPLQV